MSPYSFFLKNPRCFPHIDYLAIVLNGIKTQANKCYRLWSASKHIFCSLCSLNSLLTNLSLMFLVILNEIIGISWYVLSVFLVLPVPHCVFLRVRSTFHPYFDWQALSMFFESLLNPNCKYLALDNSYFLGRVVVVGNRLTYSENYTFPLWFSFVSYHSSLFYFGLLLESNA